MQHGHCFSVGNYSVREVIEESNYLHYIKVNLTHPTQNKYKTVNTCKNGFFLNSFILLHFIPIRVKQYSNTNNTVIQTIQ
jgi:hypothetical protein